jgi:hypothetical protein
MATVTYHISDDEVILDFKIDKHVLEHLSMETECENFISTKAFCLAHYISEHTRISIGGELLQFQLDRSEQEEDVFTLRMVAKRSKTAKEISIENNCFYEFDSTFENRVIIYQDGSLLNSYRLTNKNTQLNIN